MGTSGCTEKCPHPIYLLTGVESIYFCMFPKMLKLAPNDSLSIVIYIPTIILHNNTTINILVQRKPIRKRSLELYSIGIERLYFSEHCMSILTAKTVRSIFQYSNITEQRKLAKVMKLRIVIGRVIISYV